MILVVLALSAAACSGEAAMTVDDYAEAATAVSGDYVAESQELSFQYQLKVERRVEEIAESGSDAVLSEVVGVVRTETTTFLALLGDAIGRYLDVMEGLVPPDAVADAHVDYVAAMASAHRSLPEMRDAVAATESLEEVESALAGSRFADGQPVWLATCLALEGAVRDQGQGIDLKCEKAEVAP